MYFDIDAHRACFNTSPDEAYFWHGQTNGCGGQNNAMVIAAENNGKTLEMSMLEHRNELEEAGVRFKDNDDKTVSIDYGNTIDESKQFWDDCSKAFAEQSSGNVCVIDGSDLRPNGQSENDYPSVYNRIERPALEQNQNVNSISHIDPYTRQETQNEVFLRSESNMTSSVQSAGELPTQSNQSIPLANNEIAGTLPEGKSLQSESDTKIAGTMPNLAQNLDFSYKGNADNAGQDLAESVGKKAGD